MQKEMMTLAAALASGRPFKHKIWTNFLSKDDVDLTNTGLVSDEDFFAPVWQVQEEEKPPMRVWTNNHSEILLTSEVPTHWNDGLVWRDISEPLASALAPYIKKELNL